ncbi:MAG: DUF4271 domain-containing protein [Prevotella sp.]|nr:DUF4271 domain-containing protein [Prevotella sp.]
MILQQDSIVHESTGGQVDSVAAKPFVLTPKMVLSWLPRDATPAQQDSAIQAHFKPSEVRWSQRPDTLHLPGHDKGRNMLDVQLPQYYKEGFFSKDSLFHPELPGGRVGVAGDPIPYTIHGDNIITSILLVCFVLLVISLSNARNFIVRQVKSFLYLSREGVSEVMETSDEMHFLEFLVFLTSFILALLYYFYSVEAYGDTYVLESQYYLIAIYMGMTVAYFLLKFMVYSVVNVTLFDSKRNGQWLKSLLFITSLEGTLLFPLTMLWGYYDLTTQNAVIYFVIALAIVKILTIYKCYVIFFRRNVVKLQIILYFCTLEIVPLLAFWGALEITANSLKINF